MSALPDDIVFFSRFSLSVFSPLQFLIFTTTKTATQRYILAFVFIVRLGKDKVNIYFACTVYIKRPGIYIVFGELWNRCYVAYFLASMYPVEYTISRSATYHRNTYLLLDFIFAFISFISYSFYNTFFSHPLHLPLLFFSKRILLAVSWHCRCVWCYLMGSLMEISIFLCFFSTQADDHFDTGESFFPIWF